MARRRRRHSRLDDVAVRPRLASIGGATAIGASSPDGAPGRRDGGFADDSSGMPGAPPRPPILLTPLVACDPDTDPQILWHIARYAPELRRWLPANPSADAALLEYVAQAGGPGVREALTILLDSVES
ncbi:hypothetical protein [Bifidobacterium samirii]|uniref:Leucine rich repeat variant domain-containing protein n=1 Tax=Bifidobacterium samirii TaxID=2306974 RepID=A0A430FP96_9BIFI|nr:hypothetical protein [Bifidobacterium samirii]RSX54645.1 hypothetical protein D2E24_1505 [Bifidobacterium samirii]